MKFKINKNYISILLNIVFIVFALTFLVDSGLHRLCIYLATLLWIIEGNFKEKFNQLYEQKIILIYLLILCCFLFSLTFLSSSIENGFWYAKYSNGYVYLVDKPIQYFLMAIFISTSLKKDFLKWVLIAFLIQLCFFSIYYLGLTFDFYRGERGRPFGLHRIASSFSLSLGVITCIYFYTKFNTKLFYKIILVSITLVFILNIIIIGGRNSYLIILSLFAYVLANKLISIKKLNFLKVVIILLTSLSIVIFSTYNVSHEFKERVDAVYSDINSIINENNYKTSTGIRLSLYETSFSLLFDSPQNIIFGLGMGDTRHKFITYIENTDIEKLSITKEPHVHNQYLQIWLDGGVFALILFILIFIYLFRLKTDNNTKFFIYLFSLVFLIYSLTDNIYHNSKVVGLFAFFLGLFLSNSKNYIFEIKSKSFNNLK